MPFVRKIKVALKGSFEEALHSSIALRNVFLSQARARLRCEAKSVLEEL